MKKLVSGLALGVILASCGQQTEKGNFVINAHIDNAPLGTVYLEELTPDESKIVDSVVLKDATGKFSLKGTLPEQGLYQIRFGETGHALPLGLDAGTMSLDGDYEHLELIKIENSEATAEIMQLLNDAIAQSNQLSKEAGELDSLQTIHIPDSLLNVKEADLEAKQKAMDMTLLHAAQTTKAPAVAIFAVSVVNKNTVLENQQVLSDMKNHFPENTQVNNLINKLTAAAPVEEEPNMTAVQIGQPAPDFTLPDPSGKNISLSSLKGKYVLVDFWASWCRPCRGENPNVVANYNKFKDKNFTILGVSLDKEKGPWQKAIQDDGLTWNHVSDLKFWESAVVSLYGINSIPTNMLLDPQGKVIAKGLRGEQLSAKLAEVLK